MLVRHDVDRLGRASSASSESGSLELLLILHATVGATTPAAHKRMQQHRSSALRGATAAFTRARAHLTRVRASRLRSHAPQGRPCGS